MATDLERLVVQLSADIKGYENGMRKALGVTNSQARAIENRYRKMNSVLSRSITAPLAGVGAALSTREIMKYADAWTQAGNMVAAAAQYAGVQTRSLSELRQGADEARTSLSTYVDLYAKLIRSASGVAKSEDEIALATSLVAKAMKAGGAGVQEQQAAILQLGQALGSGVLQGDELRSLRENAPVVAQAIAEEFGTTIAGLKKLGEEGKLTSDRVFRAIINAQKPIEAQFAQTNQTIADGFVKLGNAVTEYVGKAFAASGATGAINAILGALAGNIGSVAAAAAAAGAVILSRYVPSLARAAAAQGLMIATNPFLAIAAGIGAAAFAFAEFSDDIRPVEGELASLADYAAVIGGDILDAASVAGTAISEAFLGAINVISEAMGGLPVTWADVAEVIKGIVNAQIGTFVAAYNVIVATFTKLPAAVAEKVIDGVNVVIDAIEKLANKTVEALNGVIGGINHIPGVEIGTLSPVELGRVRNDYEGAGAAAGEAYGKGVSDALAKDYLGDVFKGVEDEANLRAFRNKIGAAIDGAGSPTGGTEGFGGGIDAPSDPGGGSGKGKRAKKDDLEREIGQIQKRTAELRAQTEAQAGLNPTVEDYGYAVAKATAEQELLTAAQQAGREITPELQEQVEGLAEAYAQATVAAEKLDESQEKARDRAEDYRQLREDTTKGLVQDLVAGTDAAEAFANALGRIGDKLIDLALSDLFDSGSGVFGGRGGGLLGGRIIPGILHSGGVAGRDGYGHGRAVSPGVFAGAPRYHRGGIAGLRPSEVPAILQKGEVVIPRGARAGGGSGGGSVVLNFAPVTDARGADAAAVARIEAAQRVQAETFRTQVAAAIRDPRRR